MNSILIVLIAGIGDIILSTKALRSLRKKYPNADIHLLTSNQAAPIAENFEYIDRIWTFPVREIRENRLQSFKVPGLVRKLRKINFDIVINLYRVSTWKGSLGMGLLFTILKAREKIGHDAKGFGFFITQKAPFNVFRKKHFADAMVDMARLAGGIPDDRPPEIHWNSECKEKWKHIFSEDTSESLSVAINPGGDRHNRRWNPDNYAIVADELIRKFNARVFILGGPGEERIAEEIEKKMVNESVNLSGGLTLNDLVYIIDRMDLLVTNDSGPMHIAAAAKTPVVAIFGPEDPGLFGPYTTPDLYRIVYRNMDCRPCKSGNCVDPECLNLITPGDVLQKCVEILNPG